MTRENTARADGNTWDRQIDEEGAFQRKPTTFRDWVREDGSSDFAPEAGRYHL